MTGSMDTLLLAHVFALCLKVDHFATDTAIIANDLKLATTKCAFAFLAIVGPFADD